MAGYFFAVTLSYGRQRLRSRQRFGQEVSTIRDRRSPEGDLSVGGLVDLGKKKIGRGEVRVLKGFLKKVMPKRGVLMVNLWCDVW
jgi:hypothetical protein